MAVSSSIAILFVLCTTSGESRRSDIQTVIQSLNDEGRVFDNTSAKNTQDSLESNEAIRVYGHAQKANTSSPVPFWLLLAEKCDLARLDYDLGRYVGKDKINKGEFVLAPQDGVVPLDDDDIEGRVERHLSQKPLLPGQEFVAVKCVWDVGASGMALRGFSEAETNDAKRHLSEIQQSFKRSDIGAGFLNAMTSIGRGFIDVLQSKPERRIADAASLKAALATAPFEDFKEIRKIVSLKYAEGNFMEAKGCCRGYYGLDSKYEIKLSWSKCYRGFIQNPETHHWIPGGCDEKMLEEVDGEKQQATGLPNYSEWEEKGTKMNVLNYWNGGKYRGREVKKGDHAMHGYLL